MQKIRLCYQAVAPGVPYETQVEQACAAGVDAVQFLAPALTAKDYLAAGQRLNDICVHHNVLFLVCGRPDLALALNAALHLAEDDIPLPWARQILGSRNIIGMTISSLGRATQAVQDGADYLAVGPLYDDATMPGTPLAGIDLIRLIKKRAKTPVIGIGGMTYEAAAEVIAAGADGVVAGAAIAAAADPVAAAQALKNRIVQIAQEQKGRDYL
jgi:thiamine-phosphate pyrophosphorylase